MQARYIANVPQSKSGAQKFSEAIEPLRESLEKHFNQQRENEAVKRLSGVDLQGLQDPNLRNAFIADELSVRREERAQKLALEKSRRAAEVNKNINATPTTKEIAAGGFSKGKENISGKGEKTPERNIPRTQPVLTHDEIIQAAQNATEQKLSAGLDTSFENEYNNIAQLNQQAELQNEKIKGKQLEYGKLGESKIDKLMPDANDEIRAIFNKKGEDAYNEGKTEAEINAELSQDARKFKNTLANIRSGIAPLAKGRNFEKTKKDLKVKVQPLLDLGLYDTARNLLSELGYYPEQREEVVSDLGENAKKELVSLPKIERPKTKGMGHLWEPLSYESGMPEIPRNDYTPEQSETIKNNLRNVLQKDPTANLILLRQEYDKKGIDWQKFKDDLNELVMDGEVKLNDDQFNQFDTLEQPPLNGLEKILKNLRIL